jgi:hypothetical protein
MTSDDMRTMTVEQLIERFVGIALEQDKAITLDDSATFNKLYSRMELVKSELRSRSGDQRRALLPLLEHANAQVRLKAAIALLAIEPIAARETLQNISDNKEYPQMADARGMMRALDEGRYVPT